MAVLLAAVVACSARGGSARTSRRPAADGQTELAAVARARADSARYPYTAADVRFMSAMIGHHAQALVLAGWAESHGAAPAVLRLAGRILNGQGDEIALLQQWLRDRRQRVPATRAGVIQARHDGAEHEAHVPGMLSESQLKQLDEARGAEFDRRFLSLMIQHHQGAVAMVKELFASHGAGQDETVFKFASDVSADQSTEIERMQKMLAALILENPTP